ncbi:phosphotransferase family protein [Novosphingobium sp. KCTC 2891]|uniref:phosphotransferase family protein n=1 Tax=Novosphingobium sp. KCTC 2891 TaxID=2989730 RepID=UPI002223AB14|nr:phosphotransferase family protein [Novosphingobium sp. KCTC 2891]MCW1383175.1 phosphotransferase family protein [Novosphingobium sp. KCTC 2891]
MSEGAAQDRHKFDEAALARWMEAHVEGYAGPLAVEKFAGGQSNPTFRLTTPGRTYVMRRKPAGLVHSSAHAVDREFRVLDALGAQGFPVPRVFALCTDDAVIGSMFYVMDCVPGRVFSNPTLPELSPAERAAAFDSMNETIARLHAIDVDQAGLGDYGRPGNYVERQVARFSRQYREDELAGRSEAMDRLIEWLPANMPANTESRRLVHGDFKVDNVMFHPAEPRIIAVLDWELSTLGDPLADFAYNVMVWRTPPEAGNSLMGDARLPGLPSEEEYVAAYCRRTGRSGIPDLSFYVAFNMFRLAAILHGIIGRTLRGNASNAQSHEVAKRFHPLAEAAWQQALRAERER